MSQGVRQGVPGKGYQDCTDSWCYHLCSDICLLGPNCEHWHNCKSVFHLLSADIQLSLTLLRWLFYVEIISNDTAKDSSVVDMSSTTALAILSF